MEEINLQVFRLRQELEVVNTTNAYLMQHLYGEGIDERKLCSASRHIEKLSDNAVLIDKLKSKVKLLKSKLIEALDLHREDKRTISELRQIAEWLDQDKVKEIEDSFADGMLVDATFEDELVALLSSVAIDHVAAPTNGGTMSMPTVGSYINKQLFSRLKHVEREIRELRSANEILRGQNHFLNSELGYMARLPIGQRTQHENWKRELTLQQTVDEFNRIRAMYETSLNNVARIQSQNNKLEKDLDDLKRKYEDVCKRNKPKSKGACAARTIDQKFGGSLKIAIEGTLIRVGSGCAEIIVAEGAKAYAERMREFFKDNRYHSWKVTCDDASWKIIMTHLSKDIYCNDTICSQHYITEGGSFVILDEPYTTMSMKNVVLKSSLGMPPVFNFGADLNESPTELLYAIPGVSFSMNSYGICAFGCSDHTNQVCVKVDRGVIKLNCACVLWANNNGIFDGAQIVRYLRSVNREFDAIIRSSANGHVTFF